MEILEDNRGGNTGGATSSQTNNNNNNNGSLGALGRVVVLGAKILLGIFLVGWLLTALGVLVGSVSLAAIGESWASMVPMEGLSPVVFAGLVCAVVVLFMGIVADVGFTLLRGKQLNFKRLGIGAIVWVIFLLWLVFAAVRNAGNWAEWAYKSEMQLELWEEEFDAWEERIEYEWEEAVLGMQDVGAWDSNYSFSFEGLEGAMRFESFCDRFKEMEPHEDRLEYHLLRGGKVDVKIENHYEGNTLYRTITATSPDGDTVVTSPARILNTPTTPQVAQ